MKLPMRKIVTAMTRATLLAGLALAPALPATAQNLFETVIQVNDQAITRFEIQQRARMLTLFRAPGDPTKLAREQLIEDRLKLDAANASGLIIEESAIKEGMDEFAGRADMTGEQLVKALAGAGVSEQTFREFVRVGLTWRELVAARFVPRVSVSEEDLTRARDAVSGQTGVRVLLSEIIMPTANEDPQVIQNRATRISEITSISEFSAQARRFSASRTKDRGGRLDWQELSKLPPGLRSIILSLAPGEVSDPLPIEGAIALFQLRDIEELEVAVKEYTAIEYAAYYIDGGRSPKALARAAQVDANTDTCDDLYGIAHGQPASVLERGTKAPDEIPQDIAIELAKLDPGETSANLTRSDGQTLVFLMLCGRSTALTEAGPDDDQLTNFIRSRRLESFGSGYLEQLRAEARIIEK